MSISLGIIGEFGAQSSRSRGLLSQLWHTIFLPERPTCPSLFIRNPLGPPLLYLLLTITLRHSSVALTARSPQPTEHALQATHCGRDRIHRISRYHQVQPPRAIAQQDHEHHVDPRPIHHVPHVLGQALSIEV